MIKELKQAVLFTLVTMLLFGGIYPLLVWGIGQVAFPAQAQGSLITRADGSIVGSTLIAQKFTAPRYFHPRPSAVDYNAASTGGSNLGPSNPDQLTAIRDRVAAVAGAEGVAAEAVPVEMTTASGAGLDPHIPPAAADLQINRIASARGVPADRIRDILRAHVEPPVMGMIGRPRVNVLELNLALDRVLAQ
jgi:K+-transporting ATPase ATPase C chain